MSKAHGELLRFLVVGSITVLIDLATYRLTMYAGLPAAAAKTIGFLAGTIFAYLANRHWTFEAAGRSGQTQEISRFAAVYCATLVTNVAVNGGLLALLGKSETAIGVAFLIATGISAALNFLGMKFLVFRTVGA